MGSTVPAAFVTAGLLGVTHAIEPDHVAGITSLTGGYGDSRLSALAGACFSLGHVVLVVAWLGVASVVVGRAGVPAVYDAVGTVGVGAPLGLLGTAMALGGLRQVLRVDEHTRDDVTRGHLHVPLGPFGDDREGGVAAYLTTGLVGALFTLSPPVSMLAFASTLLPDYGASVVSLAVLTYAAGITATMTLPGAGAGALFGRTRRRSAAVHAVVRTVAGLAVVGLAVAILPGVTGGAV